MKIAEIWRYPVKSMLGEKIHRADVTPGGIDGDRRWAVVDAQSGVSLSAKRYADLLRCRASTNDGEVTIEMPDGAQYRAGSAAVARGLSELLGRDVVTRSAGTIETIQHEFPTAITEGDGDPFLWEPETDAFFDCAPLHLMTTGTLAALQRLLPESRIDCARFRPNFLVATSETGFIENEWLNNDVTLGSLECQVYDHMRRCVMVTRSQGTLSHDTNVVRTIFQNNDGNTGVALKTARSGVVRRGDAVEVHGRSAAGQSTSR